MQPGHWGLMFLTAKRSAEPAPYAPDEDELVPIRPEAWAAWAKAEEPEGPVPSSTEQPPETPGPRLIGVTAGRSRWFWGAFVR